MAARRTVKQDATPADMGTMWRMTHEGAGARCALFSFSSEWELRLLIDGQTVCSKRCRLAKDLFTLAAEWRVQLESRGWTPVRPRMPLRSAAR